MGKRTWLEELITNTYLPAIAKLKDTVKGRAKVEQLAQEMRHEWTERGLSQLTQQQGLMDRTRRAIKDQFGEEHFSLEARGKSLLALGEGVLSGWGSAVTVSAER